VPAPATGVAGAPRPCSVGIELDCARSLSAKGLRRLAGRHGVCERHASCNAFDYRTQHESLLRPPQRDYRHAHASRSRRSPRPALGGVTRIRAAARAIRSGRWDEMRYVGEAQMVLLRAQAMRWLRPLGKFVETSVGDQRTTIVPSTSQDHASRQIAAAIDRASRYGVFRPLCLTRAVALSRMLNAHGIAGHSIRIGVRHDRGSFTAHAWVELGHRVLGDTTANTLAYLPLTQVSVTGNPALSGIVRHRLHRGPRHSGDRLTWDQ